MILEVKNKTIFYGVGSNINNPLNISHAFKSEQIENFLSSSDINYDYGYFYLKSLKELKKLKRKYGIVRRKIAWY